MRKYAKNYCLLNFLHTCQSAMCMNMSVYGFVVLAIALAAVRVLSTLGTQVSQHHNEKDVIDYVCMNSYGISEVFIPGELHFFLETMIGKGCRSFLSRRVSVGMPPEKFNDNMIEHLVAINGINRIYLYDRDDPTAKPGSKMMVAPIYEVATFASVRSIEKFRQRFPHAEIIVLQSRF